MPAKVGAAGMPGKPGSAGKPGKAGSAGKPVPEAGAALLQEGPTGLTLRSIKGIGDVVEGRLREVGVTSVEEVAAWTDADVERVASSARVSAERIRREDWIGQARSLVSPT
jgi:NADH-quinone oxidoreductase subunit E